MIKINLLKNIKALLFILLVLSSCNLFCQTAQEWLERGITRHDNGQYYEEAILDFNRAIELEPKLAKAYFWRGMSKYNLGYSKDAIVDFNKAIELKPNEAKFYSARGLAKQPFKDGDYTGAIADFTTAIGLDPKENSYYSNRGYAKYRMQDYGGAMGDFNNAIKLKDAMRLSNVWYSTLDLSSEYSSRGDVKFQLGDYRGAIADYTKSIEESPWFLFVFERRAKANYKLGDLNNACLDWSKAGELGSSNAYDSIKKYCNSIKR
jgi:tetratricopeptide (TPR) repeat protein